jgi:outer membrane protein
MKRILIFLLAFISSTAFSQELLSLDSAIAIMLRNNYDVRIVSAQSEQAKNNNTTGNAGMLPTVDANASYLKSTTSLTQEYNNGSEVARDAAEATTTNANLEATWTVFNGLQMFYTRERLSNQFNQSLDKVRMQMETSIEDLVSIYYTIIRQNQLLKALKEEMKLSDDRLLIAERKMNNGSGSRLDWLQAKTEYNRQQSLLIQLQSSDTAARINLNRILSRNLEETFLIPDTVIVDYHPDYSQLKKTVTEQNNTLKFYSKDRRIAELQLKETKALRSPVIDLNARYGYTRNSNEAGFVLLNKSTGFYYGAQLFFPLFEGFNIRRQVRNAKLDFTIADLTLQSYNLQISEELMDSWRNYNDNIELLRMEEENIIFAREVLAVAHERYRIGLSSVVDLQEAQRTFENAMVRVADARFNTKMSETTLRRLNGELITIKK